MEERESKRRSREGVRWLIRERIMEELQERHHMDDGELLEMIDRSIGEMGQEIFLPLKERLWLRASLTASVVWISCRSLLTTAPCRKSW